MSSERDTVTRTPVQPALTAAVVQDATSGRVLMLGWMDAEAERLTRETGQVWFWSRSRQRLWRKGETSGNTLTLAQEGPPPSVAESRAGPGDTADTHAGRVSDWSVVELRDDCDGDALLVRVVAAGPTCHTGSVSCFAPELWRTVTQRALERPSGSYVTSLLDAGTGKVAQKVGEEAVETVVAALSETDERLVEEAADLVFHLYVLLAARGIDVAAVDDELRRRAGTAPSGPP